MKWVDLSDEAQSIIEWVEDPFTNRRRNIKIKVGGYFNPIKSVNIKITKKLFKEICDYVRDDKELTYFIVDDELSFYLNEDSKVKLH